MAVIATDRLAWTYTDDNGLAWRVAALAGFTTQNVLGGAAAAGSVLPKPASIKMRRISVNDGAGHSRVVPVYDRDTATTPPIVVVGAVLNFNAQVADTVTSVAGKSTGYVIKEGTGRASPITKDAV
jgi:hypothetical protein